MRSVFMLVPAVMCMAVFTSDAAVLSGNLIQGGDFEDTGHLKTSGSWDASNNYVPIHRFNQDTDLGKWIAMWGPPSQADNPQATAGFSLWDDVRTDPPGNNQETGDIGTINRSVDPTDPSNHLLEVTMFRPSFAQWIAAPENHVAGPFRFSFDFIDFGAGAAHGSNSWGNVYVYGMNVLPPHDVGYVGDNFTQPGAPQATKPSQPVDGVHEPYAADGDLLFRYVYGEWKEGQVDLDRFPESQPLDYLGVWHTIDTAAYPGQIPDPDDPQNTLPGNPQTGEPDYLWWSSHVITTELTQAYAYYAVVVRPFVYDESDPYFWLFNNRITDDFVAGFDNFNLQLALLVGCPPSIEALRPGDFNLDGQINTADIVPFIMALTNPLQIWIDAIVVPFLNELVLIGELPQPKPGEEDTWMGEWIPKIIERIDLFPDMIINTADINPFIEALTGGGSGAVIPEPGSIALLGLGALALLRRRR
jgi:hypothetical protein